MTSTPLPQNELREEMARYREYLAEQAREEQQKERELDALVNTEVEKQWGKRLEQWRKEREARKKLMQDVMETRKKQIKVKCESLFYTQCYYSFNLSLASFPGLCPVFVTCSTKSVLLLGGTRLCSACFTIARKHTYMYSLNNGTSNHFGLWPFTEHQYNNISFLPHHEWMRETCMKE